jgi:hypothetical protein
MHCRCFHRSLLQIFAILSLIFFFSVATAPASAQTIVSEVYNPATGVLTAQDTAGNTYTVNLAGLSPTSLTTVSATVVAPNGTSQPVTFSVHPIGSGQFLATGTLPDQLTISCSVNVGNGFAACTSAPSTTLATNTSRSLAAGTTGEVRSQATAVIDTITARLRAVTRDMAQGLGAPAGPPAAPGDTVILKDFSSDQPLGYRYNGASAGSPDMRWGAWADSSGSFLGNNTSIGYSGTSVVALTGLDYLADRQWLLGMSAGYTHADLSLTPRTLTHDADGALVGPYAAYIINPNMAVDALFNYTALGNSISAPMPLSSGSYHSNRLTSATDLDLFTDYDAIKLTGYGGYAYTWEGGNVGSLVGTGSGLANNIRYGAFRLGGEAAYDIGAFEPYVPITFEYQTTTPDDGSSRAALILGGGLRYRWSDALTGGLLVETTEIKTHTRDVLIGAHLRWSF